MISLDEKPLRYVDRVWMICYRDKAGVVYSPPGKSAAEAWSKLRTTDPVLSRSKRMVARRVEIWAEIKQAKART